VVTEARVNLVSACVFIYYFQISIPVDSVQ
jgi:hypothetical protein